MNQVAALLRIILDDPQDDDRIIAAKEIVKQFDTTSLSMFGGHIYGSLRDLVPFLTHMNCTAIAYSNEPAREIITVVYWDPESLTLKENLNKAPSDLTSACPYMFKLELNG